MSKQIITIFARLKQDEKSLKQEANDLMLLIQLCTEKA
jgi:hypothetical protein